MNRVARMIWIAVFLPLLAGCAGYQLAHLPDDIHPRAEIESRKQVHSGDRVRLTLESGQSVEGAIVEIAAEYLEIAVFSPTTKIRCYPLNEISRVEIYVSTSAAEELGVAALVVGGVVGGYFLVNSGDGGGQLERQVAK